MAPWYQNMYECTKTYLLFISHCVQLLVNMNLTIMFNQSSHCSAGLMYKVMCGDNDTEYMAYLCTTVPGQLFRQMIETPQTMAS